jgi:LemA protein
MSTSQIAVIGGALVLMFWTLGAYNRLVRLRQTLAVAFAKVDDQLKQRHELQAELITVATAELADTPEAVAAVDAARRQARIAADHAAHRSVNAGRIASLALAEQVLRTALSRLLTLVKARPALKGDPRLREVMKQLSSTQQRLSTARETFNAAVLDYNHSVRQFPTRLLAAMFGFGAAGKL